MASISQSMKPLFNSAGAPRPNVERDLWPAIAVVLRRYWYLVGVSLTLVVGTSFTELLPPLILKNLVDTRLATNVAEGIFRLAVLYMLAITATRAIQFALSYVVTILGQNILFSIRMMIARRLELLPLAYFDRTPVGELMSRCTNDVDTVNTLFSAGMMNIITDLFRIFGVLLAMFAVNRHLTVVVVLSIPLVLLTSEYFRKNVREYQRRLRILTASIYSFLQEAWSGARVIRTYGEQSTVCRRLESLQADYIEAADGASLFNAYFPGLLKSIEAATAALVIWYGARPAVLSTGLTLGGLVAFTQLIARLHSPLQNLGEEWQTIQEALSGVERITEFLREPIDEAELLAKSGSSADRLLVDKTPAVARSSGDPVSGHSPGYPSDVSSGLSSGHSYGKSSGNYFGYLSGDSSGFSAGNSLAGAAKSPRPGAAVEISHLTFGYLPDKPVLTDVSLRITPGERIVVVGRTGAGKTSLLHLLAGLYKPWNGTIKVDGREPSLLSPAERRRLLGVVPQSVYIFDASVSDNVSLLDSTISRQRIEDVCKLVGLHETIQGLPEGYDTRLGSGGTQLSFGQNQLLCLARALVSDPPLLLLDEPTSGTDVETEKMLFQALKEAGQSRTMIMIAHRLTGIIDAQRVIVVSGGQVVQDGTPEELAGKTGWFKVFKELDELGWNSNYGAR